MIVNRSALSLRFDAIRGDQINTTGIPEVTEEQMRKGVVGHLYRPMRTDSPFQGG